MVLFKVFLIILLIILFKDFSLRKVIEVGYIYISLFSEELKFSRGFFKDKINCFVFLGVVDCCESNEK